MHHTAFSVSSARQRVLNFNLLMVVWCTTLCSLDRLSGGNVFNMPATRLGIVLLLWLWQTVRCLIWYTISSDPIHVYFWTVCCGLGWGENITEPPHHQWRQSLFLVWKLSGYDAVYQFFIQNETVAVLELLPLWDVLTLLINANNCIDKPLCQP